MNFEAISCGGWPNEEVRPNWQRQVEEWRSLLVQRARKPSRKRVHDLRSLTLRQVRRWSFTWFEQPPEPSAMRGFRRWNKEGRKLRSAMVVAGLLAILLGPYAAFLTIASVITIQALFFADGGLLALGCNIINMGFFPPALLLIPSFIRSWSATGRPKAAFCWGPWLPPSWPCKWAPSGSFWRLLLRHLGVTLCNLRSLDAAHPPGHRHR